MSEIPCKEIAQKIIDGLKLKPAPKKILAAVLVGENSASVSFLRQKEKAAKELGIDFRVYEFPENIFWCSTSSSSLFKTELIILEVDVLPEPLGPANKNTCGTDPTLTNLSNCSRTSLRAKSSNFCGRYFSGHAIKAS